MMDILRKLFFAGLFITFTGYSVWATLNYDPKPKSGEKTRKKWTEVPFDENILRTGDLIVRHGKGFVSECMLKFNNCEEKYSHSGIIHREGNKVYVYNSIGGESRENNKMLMEALDKFVHPDIAFNFGIYRYDLDSVHITTLDSLLGSYYKTGLEFDLDFDMYSEEKMYCSEMIYKSMIFVSKDKNYLPLSRVDGKPYVAIDDLYLNSHCKHILEYTYD